MPIAKVVDKRMWGPTWQEDGVDLKRKNLEEALKLYPSQTGANINKRYVKSCGVFLHVYAY